VIEEVFQFKTHSFRKGEFRTVKMKVQLSVLGVLAGLFACCLADTAPKCGPLQKIKVRRQWDRAFGEGSHRLEFAVHLFNKFFKEFPKAREMFSKYRGDNIYSAEFQASSQRILGAFSMLIETTDDPAALKVLLGAIKANHAEIGIKPEFYEALRDELLDVLPKYLGVHFDWDAWMNCLNVLLENLNITYELS